MHITVVREITKKFEEVSHGTPSELMDKEFKGEIVILISNHKGDQAPLKERVARLLELKIPNKTIVELLKDEGFKKNEIYEELK